MGAGPTSPPPLMRMSALASVRISKQSRRLARKMMLDMDKEYVTWFTENPAFGRRVFLQCDVCTRVFEEGSTMPLFTAPRANL